MTLRLWTALLVLRALIWSSIGSIMEALLPVASFAAIFNELKWLVRNKCESDYYYLQIKAYSQHRNLKLQGQGQKTITKPRKIQKIKIKNSLVYPSLHSFETPSVYLKLWLQSNKIWSQSGRPKISKSIQDSTQQR